MNKPTKYTEARIVPFDDSDSINHFAEHVCRAMMDDASRKILDCISSCGEYSFRLHSITANNVPEIQSTEFRLVLEILKITRCKNCIYRRGDADKYCSIHPYRGLAEQWDDDWFCRDGKEKNEQEDQEEKV